MAANDPVLQKDIRKIPDLPEATEVPSGGEVAMYNPGTAQAERILNEKLGNVSEWTARTYRGTINIVNYNDSPWILNASTPYVSTDIAAEITAGDWLPWAAPTANFNYVDFIPQDPLAAHEEGRFQYDDIGKTFIGMNDIPGLTLPLGEKTWFRVYNDNAFDLTKGKIGYVKGALNGALTCGYADATDIDISIRVLGGFANTIAPGEFGYIVRFGIISDIDTSTLPVNTVLYVDPDNPGDLTGTKPSAPDYPVRIGIILNQDAVSGVLGIDTLSFNSTDTANNFTGGIDGIATQTPQVDFLVDTGVIYADVTNEEDSAENLPFLIDGDLYFLDTTTGSGVGGAARVSVPAGASSTEKQWSIIYVYLNAGTPTLASATTEPSIPFVKIAEVVCFDATTTNTDGVFGYRRVNDAICLKNGVNDGAIGIVKDILSAIREKLGSNWDTGQDATPTVDNSNIRVALSAGVGRQFRKSSLPSFDGLSYRIYNDSTNTVTWAASANLTDITTDANGNSLLSNNRHYTIRLFYQLNSNGIGNNVIATRPLGSYTTASEAISDPLSYTVNVNDTDIEEIVYPLYDLVITRTGAGGTTITLAQLTDLRKKLPGSVGGGGAAGGAGTDDKVRISSADTTNDYLENKLAAGKGITITKLTPGANEQLEHSADVDVNRETLAVVTNNIDLDWDSKNNLLSDNRVSVSAAATITYLNATNAELATLKVAITNLATLTFPSGTVSNDTNFTALVWTPPRNGNFTIEIFKTGTEYSVSFGSGEGSITLDSTPTSGSTNAVESGGIYDAFVGSSSAASNTLTFSKLGAPVFYSDMNLSGGDVNLVIAASGNLIGSQVWFRILADGVHAINLAGARWDSDAIHGFTSGDILNAGTYWCYTVYGPNGTHLSIDKFVDSGIDSTPPRITGYSLASGNAYVIVSFSEGVYGANDGTTPVALSDLNITNFVPSGVTAISISSVTKTNDSPLGGGEVDIKCNLSLTGIPDGSETFEIQPTDGASLYDEIGNAMLPTETTGTITLSIAWTPAALGANLITGLNAGDIDGDESDNSAYSNNDLIATITDIGVNSNDATAAVGLRALYQTDQENLLFDGTDDEYTFASPITIDTTSSYLAIGIDPLNNLDQRILTDGTDGIIFIATNLVYVNIGGGLQTWLLTDPPTSGRTQGKNLYEFIFTSQDVELFVNGDSYGTLTITNTSFEIDTFQGRGGTDNMDGRWMGMWAVDRLLTAQELSDMRFYINSYHSFF